MKNLEKLNDPKDLEALKEVLARVKGADTVATLKQFIEHGNAMNDMVLSQAVCHTTNEVYVNGNMVHVTLRSKEKAELMRIHSMWESVLKRGTQRFLTNKANDYALVIDLIKQELEAEKVYIMSFISPLFVGDVFHENSDTASLSFAFPLNNLFFDIETMNLAEIEYQEAQMQGRDSLLDARDESAASEGAEFISTEEYTSV